MQLPIKELRFFDEILDLDANLIRNGSGIDSKRFTDYYQDRGIGKLIPLENLELDKSLHIFDATPTTASWPVIECSTGYCVHVLGSSFWSCSEIQSTELGPNNTWTCKWCEICGIRNNDEALRPLRNTFNWI